MAGELHAGQRSRREAPEDEEPGFSPLEKGVSYTGRRQAGVGSVELGYNEVLVWTHASCIEMDVRVCVCVCVHFSALTAKRAWKNEVPVAASTLSAPIMASKVHPPLKGAGLFGEMADPRVRAGCAPGERGVSWEKHGDARKRGTACRGSHRPTLEQSEQQDKE